MLHRVSWIAATISILGSMLLAQIPASELFSAWDTNRNGKVSQDEFSGDLTHFVSIDTNNDGSIVLQELEAFLGNVESQTVPPRPGPVADTQLRQKVSTLEQELDKLRQENARLQKDGSNTTTLRSEITRLQQENARLQQDGSNTTALRNEIARLQQENTRLQQDGSNTTALRNEIARLQQENARLQKETKPNINPAPVNLDYGKKEYRIVNNVMSAKEYARVDAYDMLAKAITGHMISACSKNVNGENQLEIYSKVPPTALMMVDMKEEGIDTANGLVRMRATISREYAIASIKKSKEMNGQKMSHEQFMELSIMLPETISVLGYGAYKDPAKKMLMAAEGARLDAKRKLVEKLRGVTVQGSTRLQDFVVQEHEVVVTIQNTWLVGVRIVDDKVVGDIVESTVEVTRANFIYSIRMGLEKAGLKMTPEEYLNLSTMMSESVYTMKGECPL